VAKGLGGDFLSEVTVNNLAWLYRDADRRGITPGLHLNAIVTTFRVAHALGPGPDDTNEILGEIERGLST